MATNRSSRHLERLWHAEKSGLTSPRGGLREAPRSRSCTNMFLGRYHKKNFSLPSVNRILLYVTFPARWNRYEVSRALVVPELPIFAYSPSAMLGAANVDAGTWNPASCDIRALDLRAF